MEVCLGHVLENLGIGKTLLRRGAHLDGGGGTTGGSARGCGGNLRHRWQRGAGWRRTDIPISPLLTCVIAFFNWPTDTWQPAGWRGSSKRMEWGVRAEGDDEVRG